MSNNILFKNLCREEFSRLIDSQGYVVVEDIIEQELIEKAKIQLKESIDIESELYGKKSPKDYGMLICCPIYGGSFLEFAMHQRLMSPFNWILGDTSIIYVYTSSSLPPHSNNHASRIHIDRPHYIKDYIEALGCLILLDDFTEENGATWVLPGSHLIEEEPSEDFFYANAKRIIAPKGSVFYFHLRLWHAGGLNTTDSWRHSLGIGMVRGYLKQRIDLPRALRNTDISNISDYGLQKLGFFSQPPTSLEEYYSEPEKRSYRQRSEWLMK